MQISPLAVGFPVCFAGTVAAAGGAALRAAWTAAVTYHSFLFAVGGRHRQICAEEIALQEKK